MGTQASSASLFRSVASDFYINQKLSLKLDLPRDRQPVLDLFDRLRREHPEMDQLRRYAEELALESSGAVEQKWAAVRETTVRSGYVNAERLEDAYDLHAKVLELAPFFLSITPLDVQAVEVLMGFDLLAPGGHDEIVRRALFSSGPLAELLDEPGEVVSDVQPSFALQRRDETELEIRFDVKTRASSSGPGTEGGGEPISVYVNVRKSGPVSDMRELPGLGRRLAAEAEALAIDRALPTLIEPLRRAIAGF